MDKSSIIRYVALLLRERSIFPQINHETDLYLSCSFDKVGYGDNDNGAEIHYEASVHFDERIRTAFFWDKITFIKRGCTSFSKPKCCHRYCHVTNQNPDYEMLPSIPFNLAEIPVLIRTVAKHNGWRFKVVFDRKDALYPPIVYPVSHAKALKSPR